MLLGYDMQELQLLVLHHCLILHMTFIEMLLEDKNEGKK